MRCMALAQEMITLGWQISFACRPGSIEAVPALSSWNVLAVDGQPEAQIASLREGGYTFDAVIIDHYGLDATFEDACRTFSGLVAVIDDMPGHRTHRADILIDGSPGRTAAEWNVSNAKSAITGAAYALVRSEVTQARPRSLKRRGSQPAVERILVSFGLSDSGNATRPAVAAARAAFPDAKIDVVIGSTSAHHDSVRSEADAQGADLHVAPSNYIDLIVAADLAVGAGGVSALERACLGVPSVVVETAENQRDGIDALTKAGAIVHAGTTRELASGWPAEIFDINAELCTHLSQRSADLIDGRGAFRAARALDTYVRTGVAAGHEQP